MKESYPLRQPLASAKVFLKKHLKYEREIRELLKQALNVKKIEFVIEAN